MTSEKAETLRIARSLFAGGTLIGVVSTGDGVGEAGHAFCVADPITGIALCIQGAGVQVFKFTSDQLYRMRASGELASPIELGSRISNL